VQFTIPADHPSLPGHFPGNPVVPGVLVLDRVLDAVQVASGVPVGALRLPPATVSVDGVSPKWRFRVHHGERMIASGEVVLVEETA